MRKRADGRKYMAISNDHDDHFFTVASGVLSPCFFANPIVKRRRRLWYSKMYQSGLRKAPFLFFPFRDIISALGAHTYRHIPNL